MKGMPLPSEFQGKGVLDIAGISSDLFPVKWNKEVCFVGAEPTSVLETTRSPSPPTSSSTSLGGGGGGGGGGSCVGGGVGGGGGGSSGMTSVAAVSRTQSQKWPQTQQQQDTSSGSNVVVESGGGVSRREEWVSELQPISTAVDITGGGVTGAPDKCGLGMDDWVSILSEPATSPSQEQSIFRWIMGDADDSSMGLNRLLQTGGSTDFEFNGGLGLVDQGFGLEPAASIASAGGNLMNNPSLPLSLPGFTNGTNNIHSNPNNGRMGSVPNPSLLTNSKIPNTPNPIFSPLLSNMLPISLSPGTYHPQQQQPVEPTDEKPQIFNPQVLINQHQIQSSPNPAFFLPLSAPQQEQQLLWSPPQPKRQNSVGNGPNSMIPKQPFLDSGQELLVRRQQQQQHQHQHPQQQQQLQGFPHQLQLLPHNLQQRPAMAANPKMASEEEAHNQHLRNQLYEAAEMLETGNFLLAQGILARLNQQLSPVGKAFERAALYFKEALELLLRINNNSYSPHPSPFNLIFKIGAYKSFSEISPVIQFANFTCIQALLEALEGFDRIHIIDFDIGYGGQWASLMQELALRNGSSPSLKITAFVSAATHDELELSLARENLNHFASQINMAFELEILSLDSLNSASWSLPFLVSENEAIAVNLPAGSSNYSLSLPLVLRFVKQLSPKIVVSLDRGCDRSDLPFPHHIIHALHAHWTLLESLDAVNANSDTLHKIERYLVHPEIEKTVLGRHRSREKMPHWRTLFLSCGFSPLTFSNFNESQAEYVVKRSPFRGFHVEKRHSSLVLYWQRKELISASAWRC
ncbi:scarecrow-like protein 6 [Malania oleifera]|uniref:scarecrow-like protein 6 n=1 Tax=Malania oleifera TaxID=397392 RepID=UPI0025AE30EF|nr:scarecrow-like protein 6 [Malania oleifera]